MWVHPKAASAIETQHDSWAIVYYPFYNIKYYKYLLNIK